MLLWSKLCCIVDSGGVFILKYVRRRVLHKMEKYVVNAIQAFPHYVPFVSRIRRSLPHSGSASFFVISLTKLLIKGWVGGDLDLMRPKLRHCYGGRRWG